MPERLPGLPQMRSIPDPTSYEPLAGFSCGGESEHELDVDKAVDELRELSPEDAAVYEVRAAEHPATRDLIGLSVFDKRAPSGSEVFADAVCLEILAINQPYRDWRMHDGVTRIGTFLLCDALAQIERMWGNPNPMPYVWGVVHRDNTRCQHLLSKRRFWRLDDSNRDRSHHYFVHLRDEGVDWVRGFTPEVLEAVERAATS